LSLANTSSQTANKRHHSKPAPLFVIEHTNVVPPLQKQLSPVDKPKHRPEPVQKKSATENASPEKDRHNQNAKANSNADRSNKAQQFKDKQPEVTSPAANAYPTRSVARTPALVTMNNEPIPHKRRRRQPSVDNTNLTDSTEKQVAANNTDKTEAKYAKKAPKPAVQSTGKAKKTVEPAATKTAGNKTETNKATVSAKAKKPAKAAEARSTKNSQNADSKSLAGQVSDNKMDDNKGPVPSKRRRRQPSTDNV
jgi:poly(A) polymerase